LKDVVIESAELVWKLLATSYILNQNPIKQR
jgi:hypothetical protein